MGRGNELLTIGELAARTGLSVSAVRFYEGKGLVHPIRTSGNQRRFLRSDIRRVSFALIAQQLGFTLPQIATELAKLAAKEADAGYLRAGPLVCGTVTEAFSNVVNAALGAAELRSIPSGGLDFTRRPTA